MVKEAQSISNLLPDALKSLGCSRRKEKILGVIEKEWIELVGRKWAKDTRPVGLKQDILQVEVKSSAVLYELAHFEKERLLKEIQTKYAEARVRDINFRVGGG
jgi:hypothetical protein